MAKIFALLLLQSLLWSEDFNQGKLDAARWQVTSQGDFRMRHAGVARKSGSNDFRLRLAADTVGTNDETIKALGVISRDRVRLADGTRITVELDWNDQANGSYLTAGIVLSPDKTSANPLDGPSWLDLQYIGVPPGQNARLLISAKNKGREQWLYTEGWPEVNRAGRKIGVQTVTILVKGRAVQILENGKLVYDSLTPVLSFDRAYLYLQMSSHSNYETREIYFDNIRIEH